jgi:sialic acid synthase SpsE
MSHPVYVIAEMACSHEGDPDLARVIIDGAGKAGADAVQFQVWTATELVVPQHANYNLLCSIELSREEWQLLAEYVRERYAGMDLIACVYERGSVDFCESIGVDAYKLNAIDLANLDLLRYVAATDKRIDLSVGGSTLDEIASAVFAIRDVRADAEIWLMYGYQNFPTRTDDVHLAYMMKLAGLFDLPVGYQDHSAGGSGAAFWLPAAAVGIGVQCLEKHITHDRSLKGVDHQAALNPDEFERFVTMVRELEAARGRSTPAPFSDDQLRYRDQKKTLVAARDLAEGHLVGEDDLIVRMAPKLNLPPGAASQLVDRKTTRPIPAYHVWTTTDVA